MEDSPLLVLHNDAWKSSIKISFRTFWAQIASIFDGFVVLFRLSNLLLLLLLFFQFDFLSLRSSLTWFIKQSKDGDSKQRRPTNRFRFTKYRIATRSGVFPLSFCPLSVTWGLSRGFSHASRTTDFIVKEPGERGATRSLNRHKNTTAIWKRDKLTIASTSSRQPYCAENFKCYLASCGLSATRSAPNIHLYSKSRKCTCMLGVAVNYKWSLFLHFKTALIEHI